MQGKSDKNRWIESFSSKMRPRRKGADSMRRRRRPTTILEDIARTDEVEEHFSILKWNKLRLTRSHQLMTTTVGVSTKEAPRFFE